jgi:hypothetical protein
LTTFASLRPIAWKNSPGTAKGNGVSVSTTSGGFASSGATEQLVCCGLDDLWDYPFVDDVWVADQVAALQGKKFGIIVDSAYIF